MPRKRWEAAPPDPGPNPGGLRERAERIAKERGWQPEDPEKTRRSQQHWAKFRAEQAANNRAKEIPDRREAENQSRRSDNEAIPDKRR
jgi:hypothetical protein